jgi:hypothetical protein
MAWHLPVFIALTVGLCAACGSDSQGDDTGTCSGLVSSSVEIDQLNGSSGVAGRVFLGTSTSSGQASIGVVGGSGEYDLLDGVINQFGFVAGSATTEWLVHAVPRGDFQKDIVVSRLQGMTIGAAEQVTDSAYATLTLDSFAIDSSLYLVVLDLVDGTPSRVLLEISAENAVVSRVALQDIRSTDNARFAMVDEVLMSVVFKANTLADTSDDSFIIRAHDLAGNTTASLEVGTVGPEVSAGYDNYYLHDLAGTAALVAHNFADERTVVRVETFSTTAEAIESVTVAAAMSDMTRSVSQAGGITIQFGSPDDEIPVELVHIDSQGIESRRHSILCDTDRRSIDVPEGAPEPTALYRSGNPPVLGVLDF